MNREQQEMIMWRRVYERWYAREGYEVDTCGDIADAAVAEFRKRYPAEPTAPEATAPGLTWYDEPPFAKGDADHPCWIEGEPIIAYVYWGSFYGALQWLVEHHGGAVVALNGRRVSPIAKPQEPTT